MDSTPGHRRVPGLLLAIVLLVPQRFIGCPRAHDETAQQEARAREWIRRVPASPLAHYELAAALLQRGDIAGANETLLGARVAIPETPLARAEMATAIRQVILTTPRLAPADRRRLFDEAGALVADAERLTNGQENVRVIEARMMWLDLSADGFEPDPARAHGQLVEAERLATRARDLRQHEK